MPLSSCGTQTVESSSDRLMIENTVVIQADPLVQDSWDSARKITCDWQSKLEKMVTFQPFGVADLLQVAEVKFAGSGDNVRTRMEIQLGRGPYAPPLEGLTKIGDELTVVVYAEDGGAGYDVLVKNCYAYDSRNFQRAAKIRLLNDHGCLYRPHQMEYFRRTFDTRQTGADIIAFARMNAFKFPDKMDVFLSCELEMCKGGCDTHCEMEDYPIDILDSVRGHRRDSATRRQEVEAVPPVTTFRPQSRTAVLPSRKEKVMKRRRKPKKFASARVEDEAGPLLSPPATLSPEILELLAELTADTETGTEPAVQPRTAHRPDPAKMSFSTLFAGTHTTQDTVPAQLLADQTKFEPSQLLSASMAQAEQITSLSHGTTGSNPFPPRLVPAALTAAQPRHSGSNVLTEAEAPDLSGQQAGQQVSTLQQQITAVAGESSPAPPNILSSTVIFTSPRTVEKLTNALSGASGQPKEVVIKIMSEAAAAPARLPPRARNIRDGRTRFGARLQAHAKRFANFFGARRRRDVDWETAAATENIKNVFAGSETVNMVRGFQVVSAADLAFDAGGRGLSERSNRPSEEEICFQETSFYSGLLIVSSLLLISGLLSVCSIRKLRKNQRVGAKNLFFGQPDSNPLRCYN